MMQAVTPQGYFEFRGDCFNAVVSFGLNRSVLLSAHIGISLTLRSSGTRPEADEPLNFTLGNMLFNVVPSKIERKNVQK